MTAPRPPEQRQAALDLIREGHGVQETSRRTGVPPTTISSWAREDGVKVVGAERLAATHDGNRIAWAQRRGTLIDRLGEVAEKVLERVADDDTPANEARQFMWCVAVAVDKAQLLSGGVTSRFEQLNAQRARERIGQLADELAPRRTAKDGTTGG